MKGTAAFSLAAISQLVILLLACYISSYCPFHYLCIIIILLEFYLYSSL